MSSLAILQSLKESILAQASVKAIYGEPISTEAFWGVTEWAASHGQAD
jgi:hypothetical protein